MSRRWPGAFVSNRRTVAIKSWLRPATLCQSPAHWLIQRLSQHRCMHVHKHVTLSCSPHPQNMAPQVAIIEFVNKCGVGVRGVRQPRGFIDKITRAESDGSKQANEIANHCFITYTSTSTFTSTSRGTGKTASENRGARVISGLMSFLILGNDMPFSRGNTLQVPTHRNDKQK